MSQVIFRPVSVAKFADFLGVLSEGSFGQVQGFGSLGQRAQVKQSTRSQ
jgi:hypothetical protein